LSTVTRFEMGTEVFRAASHDVRGGTNHIRSKLSMSGPRGIESKDNRSYTIRFGTNLQLR
jgi:hypothetical protein